MPPITTFVNSPIVAAKPDGVTPQTASSGDAPSSRPEDGPPATTTASATSSSQYPAAQPGARPPAPTGASNAYTPAGLAPTRTTTAASDGPAPPQPSNAPIPPGFAHAGPQPTGTSVGARSNLPPPPKAGEKFVPPPPQMGIPPPTASYPAQQTGTLPSSSTAGYQGGPSPTNLSYMPPGYQPGPGATGPSQYRPSPMASDPHSTYDNGESEGIWNSAKKWASGAGEKLASAESEVWKRINKD
ncbi:hypothetical protein MN608_01816 [Microdochium nivale]|nr:hypothetical protein MN608_01816 [Microdochium nivale]